MISLIKSLAKIDLKKGLYLDNIKPVLKIGYTEDTNSKNRISTYDTHNLVYEVLYTIPGCSLFVESALHKKFKKYLVKTEWFEYNEEIIKFLEKNNTEDLLKKSLKIEEEYRIKEEMRLKKILESIDSLLILFINNKLSERSEKLIRRVTFNSFISELYLKGLKDKESIIEYILSNYSLVKEDYLYFKNSMSENIKEILDKFNKLNFFTDKMKFICSLETRVSNYELEEFFNRIPIAFKNYYTIIGPERCKALMYQHGYLKKEYEKQIFKQEDSLTNRICSTFIVGKRYTKVYIKEELGKIYDEFRKDITPKATDLSNWFSIGTCMIPNKETGKRDMGFEILKRL